MLTNLGIMHSAMVFESCMELTADDRSTDTSHAVRRPR
jgi:hypothetical protein